MSNRLLVFNGIDGETGGYHLRPRRIDEFGALVERAESDLRGTARRIIPKRDATDLASAGWGVIWGGRVGSEVKEALKPLLDHRRSQATAEREQRFRELEYLAEETPLDFLKRHGLGLDLVDPDKLPYYLLIVGDPTDVPFDFQFELGLQHAVGRLTLDAAADYTAYAQQVVDAEKGEAIEQPTAAFFGVEHPGDPLTRLTVDAMVEPLEKLMAHHSSDWRVATLLRHAADKASLARWLDGDSVPDLLFTCSHGVRFSPTNPRQPGEQGALLCADWPGVEAWGDRGAITEEYLLAAHDVPSDADLGGLIAFNFACYSSGSPRLDPYEDENPRIVAERPFVSSLPKRLLRQGALAVIGHVDVAFTQSFYWAENSQLGIFEATLGAIMDGKPVGLALDLFNEHFALVSAHLLRAMSMRSPGDEIERYKLWTTYHDTRHFMMLGDPAVRLKVDPADSKAVAQR